MVKIGTTVRKILYKPVDSLGNNLSGKFRSADMRFEKKLSKITGLIVKPDSPIYYVLDNDDANPVNRNEFIIDR